MKMDRKPNWWGWWDTGYNPIHRPDGTRYQRSINYWAIPLHDEFKDIRGIYFQDRESQLKARKLLWRRLRHGYYDRNFDKHVPGPPTRWDNHGNRIREPEQVPRCHARRRDGQRCRARVVRNKYTGDPSNRCKWHGGHSTGPRTKQGKAASLAALARGRATRSSACRT